MAFPVVESVTESPNLSGDPHTVDLPTTVADGDLLLLVHSCYNSFQTFTAEEAGWTEFYDTHPTDSNVGPSVQAWVKEGATSDGGTTVTLDNDTNNTHAGSAHVYRISGWSGTLTPGTSGIDHALLDASDAGGASDSPDPPSLTAPWGSADNLWIAVAHSGDDDATVSSTPTNYGNLVDTQSGGGTNASAAVASSRRELATGTEDPGTYTLSESEFWIAVTFVVEPASNGGGGGTTKTLTPSDQTDLSDTLDVPRKTRIQF